MFQKVDELIDLMINYNVPIITVFLLTNKANQSKYYSTILDGLVEFFEKLVLDSKIYHNKIKVSVFGKWYDLPSRVIEPIKRINDETKDYDNYFLNLCVNYDGKEEILDSCRLIARKIKAGKMDVDSINEESIKENIYSSYFLPPDLLIKTGKMKTLNSFLLWDTVKTIIYFSDILWMDFKERDFLKAIRYYQVNKRVKEY